VTRRLGFGLRPRLLAALVATSVVTLVVAALALLPPLQDNLTNQAATDLESTTVADVPLFQSRIIASLRATRGRPREVRLNQLRLDLQDRAFTLRQRADARVIVADSVPGDPIVADTDFAGSPVPESEILQTVIDATGSTVRGDNQVTVARPIDVPRSLSLDAPAETSFVLVTQKQLTDVTTAVDQVRNAFVAAALVGLLVAVLLGIALATTLGRRLARLRAGAIRVIREGIEAPSPRDDGSDEVGDLARALAAMQEALRRQEAARRAFVATASHELRTPLTSLQGTLELLHEDLVDGRLDQEEAREQVASAQEQLRRLGNLAAELLDLSRLDAAVPLRSEPVELGELTRAVAAEFELRADDVGVRLDVPTPPGPVWASGDPGAVARVVRILLDNALRSSPPRTRVTLIAGYRGERASIEVADGGPGVPAADRERIFERFERGTGASSSGGFGLGLAIGRELAERMGGRLELAADDGAPGARFAIELPIELPAGSHPEPEPARTAR
jgi:signal transduction histidine kinase